MEDNRGDIMQILSASPALIASVVIFVVCVVIGFFGDKRLKDEKMLKEQSEKEYDDILELAKEENKQSKTQYIQIVMQY